MTRVVKGALLVDFVAEWTEAPGLEAGEDRSLSPGSEAPDGWVMYFDGAFSRQGVGLVQCLYPPLRTSSTTRHNTVSSRVSRSPTT